MNKDQPQSLSSVLGEAASTLKDWLWLVLAVMLGAILRIVNLSKASIWHDEGYTMMLAPQGPLDILSRTARDVHPPLHYLALHYWMQLFGSSEASARGFSVVFMLLVIVFGYLLVKRLFGHAAARLTALFLAVGPFLVRYSQEARMYAMVAFFLLLATWLLVRIVQEQRRRDWWWYALAIAAALYTHYFAVFIIAAHWAFMLVHTLGARKQLSKRQSVLHHPTSVLGWRWWVANALAAGLFLPWVPAAYAQFTRVQGSFWIPAVSPHTLPSTLAQFLTYTDMGALPLLRTVLALVLVGAVLTMFWRHRQRFSSLFLLSVFTFLAPLVVFALSFGRPIYIDRYFVFSAVGFYALLAVMHYYADPWEKIRNFRRISIVLLLLTFGLGLRNVYAQSDHQMRRTAHVVSQNFRTGDAIISGELYTYFDFSYYNRTGQDAQLLAPNGISGYGETSLLYDREQQIVVRQLSDMRPITSRVWMVGKTGPHDYFDNVPANWTAVGDKFTAGYTAVQLYEVR
jgi:mannosyltransferase